ncbi:glycosyltransferase family 2 protein [Halomonas sp. IOP_14]|uniref:glycosyltransferase family 2 protein n=1 Tax=Halomonas sp. IOP_14 TaxID=2873295 RepID=UPI001E5A3F88|nr:glycosyltransferase family 2 protein [Halomonas sp. IOP_14]MCD1588410.1 glycosyltransferase family 2 protein [Halomonas sp. IOP_14]
MGRYRVAIVIPAFNEEETIYDVVKSAMTFGQPIVIDDFSTDATAEKATSAGAYIVSHSLNMGYDAALNTGFKVAFDRNYDVVVTLDADGQHEPCLIEKFVENIALGADLVLGVRDKCPRFAENVFAFYTKVRYGVNDPLCGIKAYKRSLYESLGYFDSYGSIGTELALYGVKKGFVFSQVSFKVKDRVGCSRFGSSFSASQRIFRSLFLDFFKTF